MAANPEEISTPDAQPAAGLMTLGKSKQEHAKGLSLAAAMRDDDLYADEVIVIKNNPKKSSTNKVEINESNDTQVTTFTAALAHGGGPKSVTVHGKGDLVSLIYNAVAKAFEVEVTEVRRYIYIYIYIYNSPRVARRPPFPQVSLRYSCRDCAHTTCRTDIAIKPSLYAIFI